MRGHWKGDRTGIGDGRERGVATRGRGEIFQHRTTKSFSILFRIQHRNFFLFLNQALAGMFHPFKPVVLVNIINDARHDFMIRLIVADEDGIIRHFNFRQEFRIVHTGIQQEVNGRFLDR